MTEEMIVRIATKLYNDPHYDKYNDMVEERSDAIAWLCEPANQAKLDAMGIDEPGILRFVKKIIFYKFYIYRTRVKKHFLYILDDAEQYTIDGWLNDSYSSQNDSEVLNFDYKDEIRYLLDNLNESETELLVDLCSDMEYRDMTIKYGISYANLKMRISRLRKHCKQLYEEALNRLF